MGGAPEWRLLRGRGEEGQRQCRRRGRQYAGRGAGDCGCRTDIADSAACNCEGRSFVRSQEMETAKREAGSGRERDIVERRRERKKGKDRKGCRGKILGVDGSQRGATSLRGLGSLAGWRIRLSDVSRKELHVFGGEEHDAVWHADQAVL